MNKNIPLTTLARSLRRSAFRSCLPSITEHSEKAKAQDLDFSRMCDPCRPSYRTFAGTLDKEEERGEDEFLEMYFSISKRIFEAREGEVIVNDSAGRGEG